MAAAEAARAAEVEARLAVRTAEERANAVRGRADSLRRAAAAEREARLRAQRAREAREHRRGGCGRGRRVRTPCRAAAEPLRWPSHPAHATRSPPNASTGQAR